MIRFQLPSGETCELKRVVSDFNGSLAVDGKLVEGVADRLRELANLVAVIVLTSDTMGTVERELDGLPVDVVIVKRGDRPGEEQAEKYRFVEEQSESTVFLGNGRNDLAALDAAKLSIVVMGREGASGKAVSRADLVVSSPVDALDLLLKPNRLVSGLRY